MATAWLFLEEVEAIQREQARTTRWDACSTMGHAGSEDSWSDESAVLGGMAPVPEGDEKEAASSHLSSAEEDNNEEPAREAYWCRCPKGCCCAGDGDCCYCERCYHEWTWCNCDCEGCRARDLAGEAEVTADYAEGASTTSSGSRKWYVGLFGGRGIH